MVQAKRTGYGWTPLQFLKELRVFGARFLSRFLQGLAVVGFVDGPKTLELLALDCARFDWEVLTPPK
jgi:hypothetical protein